MKKHSLIILSAILALTAVAAAVGLTATFAGFSKSQTINNPETSQPLSIGAEGTRASN